ncbi:FAD-binding oxidoreductase [Pseudomonas sp. SLFW]|uniref:NAD(P)/FAD-dependent oxidoreductase n=1 Tax=Pseudomonas sp. SLFW TaxID=2683259 RepID=UPI001412A84F|nr:FAD-binding oxidoreductase [Pseudomonas sp. SLFW]NBB10231.1 FAD-dependent oxidoreductase [Pseudomonas sp. SLFW]
MFTYNNNYYTATMQDTPSRPALSGNVPADVCVVGAGLAGLSTAWALLTRGKTVALLDAGRVAWGASGRNGGFVLQGWSEGMSAIERRCGKTTAAALFKLSLEGVDIVRETIARHALPGCLPTTGKLSVIRYDDADSLRRLQDKMATDFDFHLDYLDRDAVRERLKTDRYFQALRDTHGFHFHPLNYCLGLAGLIERSGGAIYEQSPMVRVERRDGGHRVITDKGSVECGDVVYCCGGYGGPEFGKLRGAFLPIATYAVLTERLGSGLAAAVNTRDAVGDNRRASDYYRVVDGDRLLWGGRITTKNLQDEQRLGQLLTADILDVYPQLKGVKIDKAWSGLMGYARHKMPHIASLGTGLWACTSFGGHGMNTAPIGGRVIAEAICGESDRYRLFDAYGLQWNGGPLGPAAAQTVYAGLKIMDFFQETRSQRKAVSHP